MPRVSAAEWARLRKFSPQYARRRLKELGATQGRDRKFDFATIEALHAGEALPPVTEAATPPPGNAPGDGRVTKSELERRLLAAKAEAIETTNRLRSGEVVLCAEVTRACGAMISAVRQRLLSIGHKLAPALAVEPDALTCQALIDDEIHGALQELTEWRPPQK